MIQLNLLPDLKKDFLRAQRMRARTIAVAILVTIVSLGSLIALGAYVFGAQPLIIAAQTGSIKKKYNELQNEKDLDKYLTVQNQLQSISALHDEKFDMARIIDFATKVNIADSPATYLEIQTDMDAAETSGSDDVADTDAGTMVVRGFIKDFAAFKRLQDSFANATVNYQFDDENKKGVNVFAVAESPTIAIQPDENNRISFTLTLSIVKEPFTWKAKNATISVPDLDTTDSSQNTPTFGEEQ